MLALLDEGPTGSLDARPTAGRARGDLAERGRSARGAESFVAGAASCRTRELPALDVDGDQLTFFRRR